MGYSFSWVAVQPDAEPTLRAHFGLRELEETSEFADFTINLAAINGWCVLYWDHQDHLIDENLLRMISAHGRVVAVSLEEHVMFASAEEWKNGERIWCAVHMSDMDIMHIDVEGTLPAVYTAIHAAEHAKQEASGGRKAGVDHIIDIPLDLAKAVVGFRHDQGEHAFKELEADKAPKEDSARQRPICGITATHRVDRSLSVWYKNHKAQQPGLLSRLFGKN